MRYLKLYKLFKEDNEFDPNPTDAPDIKMSKENLDMVMNQIKTFKSKKSAIDQIYLNTTDDKELETKINTLLGPEISSKEDRNPFMVEYLNVSNLKRKVDQTRKGTVEDKMKLDDFGEDLKDATDADEKKAINQKITDITQRINQSNTDISKLSNDITNAEKALNTKMDSQIKDIKDYIKNINGEKSK